MKIKEELRRVVSICGHEQRLNNVSDVNTSGSWTRIYSDEGYVLINPANVLMYIIKGEVTK